MYFDKLWEFEQKNLEVSFFFEEFSLFRFCFDIHFYKSDNNLFCFNTEFVLFGFQLNLNLYETTEIGLIE